MTGPGDNAATADRTDASVHPILFLCRLGVNIQLKEKLGMNTGTEMGKTGQVRY